MTRKCSYCSNNGHNSRTCPVTTGDGGAGGGGVKLFGVRLTDGSIMKKSASVGNLSSSPVCILPNSDSPSGYLSDDPAHATCFTNRGERKKGVAWTEEEHRMFLVGLQKMGKGDWRGIARNFVISRSPTQVASHAQKYFIRHSNSTPRKRRSSLFDMVPEMPGEEVMVTPHQTSKHDNSDSVPSLNLYLKPKEDFASHQRVKESDEIARPSQQVHQFYPAYLPVAFPYWLQNVVAPAAERAEASCHQILKPVPIQSKQPVNVDETVGLSKLNLIGETEQLSLKLLGLPPRQSAFHANTPVS